MCPTTADAALACRSALGRSSQSNTPRAPATAAMLGGGRRGRQICTAWPLRADGRKSAAALQVRGRIQS